MFGRQARKRSAEIDTLIGRNTRVEGDIEFGGGCHIDGYVKGRVQAEDTDAVLSISDTGTVEGSVEVPQVILNGTVNGDVRAAGRIELGASARVVGNVYYSLIEMAIGAEVNGQLIHTAEPRSPALVTHQGRVGDDDDAEDSVPLAQAGSTSTDRAATGTGS